MAWLPVFSRPNLVEIILESWKFLQRQRNIELLAWVILENHLHWIAAGPEIGKRVGESKSYTATMILREMKSKQMEILLQELHFYKLRHRTDQDFQVWQAGSHPQLMTTDEMLWRKIEYIHRNPVERGYVDRPEDWRYSSARAYAKMPCLLDVVVDWR